ncbi:hypothetical protein AB0B13_13640 [Streptomyces sp. NPDC042898]|uniref:hypothetical protein n=1 Tax=unclassified Streptomyces TaxID=2593676 RepID=UPI00331CDE61
MLAVVRQPSTIRCTLDPELLERITARRPELDELEEHLVKQLAKVRAERDELAVAERVPARMTGLPAEERSPARPMPGQVAGRAVMLIPHREPGVEEDALPWDWPSWNSRATRLLRALLVLTNLEINR